MQAIIMAAGLGTRMGELTKNTPKPLLKIDGKTILERNFEALPAEIDEVILVVGYRKEQIQDYFGESFAGKRIRYVYQAELNGTAHAVSLCKGVVQRRFLALNGDDIFDKEDLASLIKAPLGLLAAVRTRDEQSPPGSALVETDESGHLRDIRERQPAKAGTLANIGAYLLDESFFDYPLVSAGNPSTEYGLPQTFVQMAKAGREIKVIKAVGWQRISTPEDLKKVKN